MARLLKTFVFAIGCMLALTAAARAETKVTLKGVHLCCPQCVSVVGETLKDLSDVKGECSQKEKTIVLTAASNEAAQKAVDALAKAGFYGKPDSDVVKFKPIEAPKGNVKRLELADVHNCCGQCARIISTAVKKVKGVSAGTAVGPKKEEFVIEGDFSAQEVVDALLAEGFYATLKK